MGKPTGARVLGPLQPLARGFLLEPSSWVTAGPFRYSGFG
jgi:hypothetical protein